MRLENDFSGSLRRDEDDCAPIPVCHSYRPSRTEEGASFQGTIFSQGQMVILG
jgi:hypothetical protein